MIKHNRFPEPDGKISVVPSVLSADFSCLKSQFAGFEKHADWIQVDVMDGHFVPNISFGPHIVKCIKKAFSLPVDVHLMVERPDRFIKSFFQAGADLITVHLESKCGIKECLKKIRSFNMKSGIALKPKTEINGIREFLPFMDLLLVMTVEPGFGGQEFVSGTLAKIDRGRKIIDKTGLKIWLQVDGGINAETGTAVLKKGADSLVVGNALFSSKNPVKLIKYLKNACQRKS